MNTEILKEEAIRRMKLISVAQNDIDCFLAEGIPSSYKMSDEDIAIARNIEKTSQFVIYYAFKKYIIPLGHVWYFLFVSPYTEDWKDEREYLKMMVPIGISYAPEWLPGDHIEIGSFYLSKDNRGRLDIVFR